MNKKNGFTLVELITAIVIITIISFTSFYVITDWLIGARDSQRMIDMRSIKTSLKNYYYVNKNYPTPSDTILNIKFTTFTTWYIWYQWSLWWNNIRDLKLKWKFEDPLDKNGYLFAVNYEQDKYQLLFFMEWVKYNILTSYTDKVIAASSWSGLDYSNRFPLSEGDSLWVLLNKDKKVPLNLIYSWDYDLASTSLDIIVYLSSNQIIFWSGTALHSVYQFVKNSYQPPKSCPVWFIPVPWNKDFKQPWFCVAQYEMKQLTWDAGYTYYISTRWYQYSASEICGSWTAPSKSQCINTTSLDWKIISKPEGYPIVYMDQATAINACKAMGSGYHLITENEWMAIVRNIEQQPDNRDGWIPWTGSLYKWNSGSSVEVAWCNDWVDSTWVYSWSVIFAPSSSPQCNLSNGRNKRSLKLSNNEWIRDLAGNVWEHVNKANNIDWTNYDNVWIFWADVCGIANASTRIEFNACNWTYPYSYALIWPKFPWLTKDNWVWNIYYENTASVNVLIRWGYWASWTKTWIYAFYAGWPSADTSRVVGFRCAY